MRLIPYERMAQYYETDQMGVVHHSNYIRWFEEARVDLLGQLNLSYQEMERRGVLIPVLGVACEYRRPVRFGERVRIELSIERFEATHGLRFVTKYAVRCTATGDVVTEGETRHTFTDKSLNLIRCQRVHPEVYELFRRLEAGEDGY